MSKEIRACLLCGKPVIDERRWFHRLMDPRKLPLHSATDVECFVSMAMRMGAQVTEEQAREIVLRNIRAVTDRGSRSRGRL